MILFYTISIKKAIEFVKKNTIYFIFLSFAVLVLEQAMNARTVNV